MGSFFFYGRGGSGKTTLAAQMTKLGYHVHFIDADHKVKNMANLRDLLKEGKISVHEVCHELSGYSLSEIAKGGIKFFPTRMPQGYLETCEYIDQLKDEPLPNAQNTVLCLDSMTPINEALKRLMKFFGKVPKLTFDEWDAVLSNYEELFSQFYSLQPDVYAHCIITAHAKEDRDEKRGLTETRPLFDGQFRDKATTKVEEAYFLEAGSPNPNSPAKFKVYTKPVGSIKHARTSRDLRTVVDADFEIILADDPPRDEGWEGEEEEE